MFKEKSLEWSWGLLMGLTLVSLLVAETGAHDLGSLLFVVGTVALKGRVIVDRFMELAQAHPLLRHSMRLYFVVLPLLILLTWLWPEQLARWTTLW